MPTHLALPCLAYFARSPCLAASLQAFWVKPECTTLQLIYLAMIITVYIAITTGWWVEKQRISIAKKNGWQLWPKFCSIAIFAFKKSIQYESNLVQDIKFYRRNAFLYQPIYCKGGNHINHCELYTKQGKYSRRMHVIMITLTMTTEINKGCSSGCLPARPIHKWIRAVHKWSAEGWELILTISCLCFISLLNM